MTAPGPDGQQAGDPFARARGLLEPEAKRRGLTVPELLRRLARAGRRHAPAGTGPRGGMLRWALPQNAADLPDDAVAFGTTGSGKAPSDADRLRAELTGRGRLLPGGDRAARRPRVHRVPHRAAGGRPVTPQPDPAARRRPALPPAVAAPARPAVLFSDEASAVMRAARIPEWVRTTRPPLETLTWQAPPAPHEEP